MKLNDYQYYILRKLIDSKNSVICWNRRSGKTSVLISYIEHFVKSNYDQDILFISTNGKCSINVFNKILYELPSIIVKHRKNYIELINKNYITFVSENKDSNYLFYSLKPSLVIFDDVEYSKIGKLIEITDYINKSDCESIFTMSDDDEVSIKIINSNNNYLILNYNKQILNQILRRIKLEKLNMML
jgi:hypothetical protein